MAVKRQIRLVQPPFQPVSRPEFAWRCWQMALALSCSVPTAEYLQSVFVFSSQGFQVLVESDWLDFGHKFGDRCGHQEKVEDQNEQCPVFLQWLDAVHQLLKQFPCLFEFNEAFLVRNMHANISIPCQI